MEQAVNLGLKSHITLYDNELFTYLPNHNNSDWSKMKALADDKIDVTQKLKFVLLKVENISGKGENAGSQLFFQ